MCSKHAKTPFVGYTALTSTIEICRTPEHIICRIKPATVWLVRGGMVLFGPVLTALLVWQWPALQAKHTPALLLGVIALFPLMGWLFLLRSFVFRHRIELNPASGRLRFHRRPAGPPLLELPGSDVASFEMSQAWHRPTEGSAVKNHVLVLVTKQGERIALCASSERELVDGFLADLESATGARPALGPGG